MSKADDKSIIELYDLDNNATQFEHLLTFEYGDEIYIAFTPLAPTDGHDVGEVLIMRLSPNSDDSEEDTYVPVDSQEELDAAWNAFQDLYYDEEGAEFEDEEQN